MNSEILAEAIEAMATDKPGKVNAFIAKHNGPRDVLIHMDRDGYPDEIGDAFAMLKRERNLLRAVATLARARSKG